MEEVAKRQGGLLPEAPDAGSRSCATKEGEEQKKIFILFSSMRAQTIPPEIYTKTRINQR
jgi:hypothetical protein